MAQIWKDRVQQTVTGTPGTGAFTLSTASSGYQALAAGDDGKTGFFCATEGTAWETFWGTYTHSGTSLARTVRKASSTGSAISFTSAAIVFLDIIGQAAEAMMLASSAVAPGGRLTLTTGVPVTTADVTGATTIYYTPCVGNIICLWDGVLWMPTVFAEVSLALGTLTGSKPYDVFGFLNAGALNTELLAWTNGSTRATAITLQDGRYCKSGDKTRLYLGSFYTTSTTTTEDSGGGVTTQVGAKRFVWNMYNRVPRSLNVIDKTDFWTYSTAVIRLANNSGGNLVEYFCGLLVDVVTANLIAPFEMRTTTTTASTGIGVNSTTAYAGTYSEAYNNNAGTVIAGSPSSYAGYPGLGINFLSWLESGGAATILNFYGDDGGGSQAGIQGRVQA